MIFHMCQSLNSTKMLLKIASWEFMTRIGAPCRFSGRFEDGSFSMKTKMKICSNLQWRMKMWRTQISGLLKNEDYQLPRLLKMKIAFLKLLKTGDLKTPLKKLLKMKTTLCAGSPRIDHVAEAFSFSTIRELVIWQKSCISLSWIEQFSGANAHSGSWVVAPSRMWHANPKWFWQ